MSLPGSLTLVVFFLAAIAFPLAMLAVAKGWALLFGQQSKTNSELRDGKYEAFECGLPSSTSAPVRFKAQYYHYGIVFLIFDVEVAFLLPFAVAFLDLSIGAVLAMAVFVLLLAEGLVWAWAKGILQWK